MPTHSSPLLELVHSGMLRVVPLIFVKLWAILLRNSSAAFIAQSTALDFLETIEELIISNATSPVVRNRLLDVLGDAVHSNPTRKLVDLI